MIDFDDFARAYILRWEGGGKKGYLSLDPNDNGNWWMPGAEQQRIGQGALVGSNYGVTAATLATFLGNPRAKITAADIKAISLARAVEIARKLFYTGPGLDRLPWNRVTASIMDFGWGAGPERAKKLLQNMLDLAQDGELGPVSQAAYRAFLAKGEEFAAGAWWAMRERYYEDLIARRPTDQRYEGGWDNRSEWFTPGQGEGWWRAAA